MPAETPAVWTLDGVDATPRIVDSAEAATYSAMRTPDEPAVASDRNNGRPLAESVRMWLMRDCTACAERVNASRVESTARTRYAAWKPPWCVTSPPSGVAVKRGFSEA